MAAATISHEVDEDAARAFEDLTPTQREKIQVLFQLRLRELTSGPVRPLRDVMDDMGAKAEARGLTPEILESILHQS